MFLIRRMSFSAFLLPQLLGYFRKIGVRFGSRTVYLCQAKFVSERNSLLINAWPSYNINVFILPTTFQSCFE